MIPRITIPSLKVGCSSHKKLSITSKSNSSNTNHQTILKIVRQAPSRFTHGTKAEPITPALPQLASSSSLSARGVSLEDQKARIRGKEGFIIDMDGVLYHSRQILPGVKEFIQWLIDSNKKFLFLTNASDVTTTEISAKIKRLTGFEISPDHFYTSALATAAFLHRQTPKGSAYVVGTTGLIEALKGVDYTFNDVNPDYVVVGETHNYTFQMIEKAVSLVRRGSKLIGTNRDILDRVGKEVVPSTGTLVAPIETMTNRKAYFVGKPNPLIMGFAMKKLGTPVKDTVIIGDRMDTDIQAGVESDMDTVLVLTGVTTLDDLPFWAFRPTVVFNGVKDIVMDDE